MARPILVIGNGARLIATETAVRLAGRTMLARSQPAIAAGTPPGWTVASVYDDFFERDRLTGVHDEIARDIAGLAQTADVAYVIPGPVTLVDATVSALRALANVEFAPEMPRSIPVCSFQAIDALTLAQAEEQAPFDAGLHELNPTMPTIVTNWQGTRVVDLASQKLMRSYGIRHMPDADDHGVVELPARDPLDGSPSFAALRAITARLRRPDGCPWDREQTPASLLDDFASEVGEYAQAVAAGDWENAAEELGDVLLNVVMQMQIGTEAGHYTAEDVLAAINAKLVRRHPHVFGAVDARSPDEVLAVWKAVKQQEKIARRGR